MRFFRRERRIAWVGLFALAAQFTLSFGHVHIHSVQRAAHAAVSSSCVPGTHGCPSHDDEAHCSICWTISIAGSSVVPAPAALIVPLVEDRSVDPQLSMGAFADKGSVHFQARAPPYAKTFA
jgi:hypothetical protein